MKFKTRLKTSMALIDLTPLVDVIFLMLIFFIVTSDILPLKSLLIENPKLGKRFSPSDNSTAFSDGCPACHLSWDLKRPLSI